MMYVYTLVVISFIILLLQMTDVFDDHLLSSEDKRKVVIRKIPGRTLGLKIRGGKEFQLGIFVIG